MSPSPRRAGRLGVLLLMLAAGAAAQPAGQVLRDINVLALEWARGDWRAPLVCTIDGVAHRGLRRILVTAGPMHVRPPTDRIQIFDLEVPEGTRCTDEMGRPQPNAKGTLYFYLKATSRPDTADVDFASLLRREKAVRFDIRRGRLRLGGEDGAPPEDVDFEDGTALFSVVRRGTDAWRRLAEFGGRRLLTLALESPDGRRLDLDLVLQEPR